MPDSFQSYKSRERIKSFLQKSCKMTKTMHNTKFCFSYILCFLLVCFTGCKKDFEERSVAACLNDHASALSGKPNIILFVANDFGFEIPTFNGGQSYQ